MRDVKASMSRCRLVAFKAGLFVAVALATLAPALIAGQTPTEKAKPWTLPRTVDGQPDLQGIWTNATLTPLERPRELLKALT